MILNNTQRYIEIFKNAVDNLMPIRRIEVSD
jgi:hypothetical protein